ncbi:hypothetical protein Pmani_028340 [Petrolisthes manimaculis]|uniref:Secreted protein n=1 Tax=Petrolisthes manimaculis TaxID=1843537 RepID=A0AAE1TVT1_9EUCA|nr:hypothetical protein Pmani_028340 [Petrolisthes manimaculis]
MLRFLVLASVVASSVVLCVSGASVEGPGSSRFLSIGAGHDHEYNCTGGGIFTDQGQFGYTCPA